MNTAAGTSFVGGRHAGDQKGAKIGCLLVSEPIHI
jgi:hypothetical protein